ncbi:hypothetical protein [Pseudomonas caspiana]|uniref:hypothetical protein n=1 Tax=Pseudomonas caspiana TaxID=1451454 RepID=UPI0032EF9088
MHTQSITASTLVTPSITKVLDSKEELSNPGQTEDTLLTLSGTADPSIVVSLYDGLTIVRTASVTELGVWTLSSVPASIGSHSFTILARGVASSPPWVITVIDASIKPVIALLENSQGAEIPPDTTTPDTNVTVSGSAQAQQMVELFDFAVSKGGASADINGAWRKELTNLAVGAHAMKARALYGNNPESGIYGFTVERPPLDLVMPEVLEAFGPNKDQLEFARLADGADVHVRVSYTGMATGQAVRVRWGGRVEHTTDIKTVQDPSRPIDFTIWRDQVIDSIGRRVDINYSVVESQGGPVLPSKILPLNILPQAFDLVEPTINGGYTIVTVAYLGSLTSHTIAVRWRGAVDRSTEVKRPPNNGSPVSFTIPSQWVGESRGRQVLINYSVGAGNNSLIFSQLLRVSIP